MHLFHCPALDGELIELPEEEAHHAVSVLRSRAGDTVGLLDGKGTWVKAVLEDVSKRGCNARVVERVVHPQERAARIHMAVAPTKQMERLEWFVEKAVEVGVDRITPILTTRTERNKLRVDRLQRVAVAAMKQSQRFWLPQVDDPIPLDALLAQPLAAQRFFGWCEGQHTPFMTAYTPISDALVIIGPEGDLTVDEATLLRSHACTAVTIGHARLRTETAALAACTWMSLAQQR